MISNTVNSRTGKCHTLKRHTGNVMTEGQTITRSLTCCQNQELLELLEIHAEHVPRAQPTSRWAKKIQLALKPDELPGVGRVTLVLAALCTLVVASTLLAMMWV